MLRKFLLGAVLIAGSTATVAGPIITFSEGFDDVSALAASGWLQVNKSAPIGGESWFQGLPEVFSADSGADNSYIAANFNSAGFPGNVDNWLISPVFSVYDYTSVEFATRVGNQGLGDNLQVLYSFGSTNLADFLSIDTIGNPLYPVDWTTFSYVANGSADIRLAFRYLVTDNTINGDYIGIDSVVVKAVPEPGVIGMFALALLLLPLATRRRREQA